MPTPTSDPSLRGPLEALAAAARAGLEAMMPAERGIGLESFPRGTCGRISELMGRIVLERPGLEGRHICGDAHPLLREQQSHACVEFGGFIVDLTHHQFVGTGQSSPQFTSDEKSLSLKTSYWMQYPHQVYAAMNVACGRLVCPGASSDV
jgi:hypothetical protein